MFSFFKKIFCKRNYIFYIANGAEILPEKLERLETSVDKLKQRFGKNIISFASTKENELGLETIGRKEANDED